MHPPAPLSLAILLQRSDCVRRAAHTRHRGMCKHFPSPGKLSGGMRSSISPWASEKLVSGGQITRWYFTFHEWQWDEWAMLMTEVSRYVTSAIHYKGAHASSTIATASCLLTSDGHGVGFMVIELCSFYHSATPYPFSLAGPSIAKDQMSFTFRIYPDRDLAQSHHPDA